MSKAIIIIFYSHYFYWIIFVSQNCPVLDLFEVKKPYLQIKNKRPVWYIIYKTCIYSSYFYIRILANQNLK